MEFFFEVAVNGLLDLIKEKSLHIRHTAYSKNELLHGNLEIYEDATQNVPNTKTGTKYFLKPSVKYLPWINHNKR
jgi:hypothetical protein